MRPGLIAHSLPAEVASRYSSRIADLFSVMDRAYAASALALGFHCSGCGENCCEETFFHYTVAEELYLFEGFSSLSGDRKAEVVSRADEVNRRRGAVGDGERVRAMCPLNFGGRCVLYSHRPMICRLHGIPHFLKKSGAVQRFPGCAKFDEQATGGNESLLDRTELYSEMAAIEADLRRELNFGGKLRRTVAEIIAGFR